MESKKPPRDITSDYIKFENERWESLYVEHKMKYLKLIDRFPSYHRLYLLMTLDLYDCNLVKTYEKMNPYVNIDLQEQNIIALLKKSIKNADPIYLELAGSWLKYKESNPMDFVKLINDGKKINYPKLSNYKECMKTLKLLKSLTVEFTVEDFFELCPNPKKFLHNAQTNGHYKYHEQKLTYLYDRFPQLPIDLIQNEFFAQLRVLSNTVDKLEVMILDPVRYPENLRRPMATGLMIYLNDINDIPLLIEIAFIENKEAIEFYMNTVISMRLSKLEEAMILGILHTCQCCYERELLDSEICCCPKGHTFCLKCIHKFVELEVQFKKLEIKCMFECTEHFHLDMLKEILDNKLYERLMTIRRQVDINAANIEGLEFCRFCDYAASVPQDLKVFSCLNPECGKEICRFCGEKNHLPLTCDEIEKAPELQIRIMIENKLSEVIIRVCPNCNNRFLKEAGCNRMMCTCGTTICYICKKRIVPFYEHFYHEQVEPYKCPLYTDDNVVHVAAVEAAARLIINELKKTNPELLNKINIDTLLPKRIRKAINSNEEVFLSVSVDNEVIAKILGETVKKINQLKDMRSLSSESKRIKFY